MSGEALSIALEQTRLRGADVALFNLLAAQRAVAGLRLNRMRYTDAIKRDSESIGRWYRRYFGISRRDERRSHLRLHQRFGQRAHPLAQLLEKLVNKRV